MIWGRVALASACLLGGALSCNPTGATTTPGRSGRGNPPIGLGIPYPVGEPETVEGWSRAALARASFAVVMGTGGDEAFDRRVAGSGPVVVGQHIRETDDDGRPFDALLRRAFRGKRPRAPASVAIEPQRLAELGILPPAPSIFVVGPTSNCRASVGAPTVGYYRADQDILEVDWALDGCDEGVAWAPIGVIANRLPEDTVWVAAELGLDAQFEATTGWQGPLAAALEPPSWEEESEAALEVVRVLQIPGVSPTVLQVYDSLVEIADAEAERERLAAAGLDPACVDQHATEIAHGFWNGNAWEAFAPGRNGDGSAPGQEREPHLLGAFVRGEQIDALVYDQRLDALVVIPPAPTMQGDSDWVRTTLPAAIHTAYSRASWGYLPTSDPSPLGEPCEPPNG
ncbi:MAG: hypothetical protein AAF721_19240 [Myxococcota bacterium]